MYDDFEDYEDMLHDYNSQLGDLAMHERETLDMYETEIQEIDEYWDREDKYIRDSGIYTKEEIRQILDEHNEARRRQKEEAKETYLIEKESIDFDKEQLEFERQQAEMDMEYVMLERDLINMEQEEMESRIIAARNEELAAYSDFIASLDD